MSASEKLKALEAREQWASHDASVLAGLALTLRDALPKIVALVEAAEQGERYTNRDLERPFGGNLNSWIEMESLDAALSALDEALS